MIKFLLLIFTSVIVFASCSMQSKLKSRARTVETAKTDFYKKPLLGDVRVDLSKKIIGSTTVTPMQKKEGKELAVRQAIDAAGADFIIDPIFDITATKTSVSITVTGFAGFYKEIKTATQEEMEALYAAEVGVGDPEILDMLHSEEGANQNSFSSSSTSGFPYRNPKEYEPAYRAEKGIGDRLLTGKEKRERNYFFYYYKAVEKRKAKGKKYNQQHPSVAREKQMKAGKILLGIYGVGAIIALVVLL